MSFPRRDTPAAGARVLAAGILVLVAPAALAAQNPPARPDTIPRPAPVDTVRIEGRDTATFRVPADVLPGDTIPRPAQDTVVVDSVLPAPLLPPYPQPDSAAFWKGTWVWNRAQLDRFHGLSLLDLLVTIPGVEITRAGAFGQPAGVSPWGLGGGRMRFFYDGWEVEPLSSATLDLQYVSLSELQEVRVERRLNEMRVELYPFLLPDRRPYSQIELLSGDPNTRALRGLFAAPIGSRQTVTVSYDIADTEGFRRQQPFSVSNVFARWSYLFSPRAGLQLEYRSTDFTRQTVGFLEDADRSALWLRGRVVPTKGLTLEAMAGRNWRDPEDGDLFPQSLESDQGVLRGVIEGRSGWVEAIGRVRSEPEGGFEGPTTSLELRGGVRGGKYLGVQGSAIMAGGEQSGTELEGNVRVGPESGFSLFGSATVGTRGVSLIAADSVVERFRVPFARVDVDTFPLFATVSPQLSGFRAGAEWARPGTVIGAALVRLDEDFAVPFGLRFDDAVRRVVPAEPSTGVEAYVSTPLFRPWLRLEGWYTRWPETGGRPYLRQEEGRAALVFHDLFYTGNLEPTFRVEVLGRGSALIPLPESEDTALPTFVFSQPYTVVNAFLQVRVIDVRAFVMVENAFNARGTADIPGQEFPGARVIFGIRWNFRN